MTTSTVQPVAAATTQQSKHLKKPDDVAHKKFLEDLNKKIDSLKKEQVRLTFFFLRSRTYAILNRDHHLHLVVLVYQTLLT